MDRPPESSLCLPVTLDPRSASLVSESGGILGFFFVSFIDFFLSSFRCFFQIPVAVRGTECLDPAGIDPAGVNPRLLSDAIPKSFSRFAAPTLKHQLPDLISSLFPLFRSLLEALRSSFPVLSWV